MMKKKKAIFVAVPVAILTVSLLPFLFRSKDLPVDGEVISENKQFAPQEASSYDTSNYPVVACKDGWFSFRSPPGWVIKGESEVKQAIELLSPHISECFLYITAFQQSSYSEHLKHKIQRVLNGEEVDYSVTEENGQKGVLYQNSGGLTVRFPFSDRVYELGYHSAQEDNDKECQQAFYKLLNSVNFQYD